MPTIMSQNVVRPEDYKPDTTSVGEMPLSSMDSHQLRDHNNSNTRIHKDSTASDSSQVVAMAAVTAPSKAPHSTISVGSRHHTKTRPLAIQTTSLHTIGKSSDNNSNSHPYTANAESNPSSTAAITNSSSSPPPSTASSTSSASSNTNSPMSHIRRWTSGLASSSKSNTKGTKVRTIGPISAPQPLTTPVPYACTPLPYFDLPSPDHFSIVPSPSLAPGPQQYNPRSSPPSDSTVPRSPAKPATSCPDLPVNSHTSESYLNVSTPISSYSSLNRNQRTSWKDRLFNSNPKKQDRRASTNSNVDDDYEWSSNQEADASSNPAASATTSTTTSPSTTPTVATSPEKPRPRMRISPPLTQPVLPANQKTVPIMQNPLISPTDDLFGPDTFDPFKIAPRSKATSSGPASMMMMMATPVEEDFPSAATSPSSPSTSSPFPSSSEQSSRPTVDTHIKPSATPVQQLLTPPSSHSSEDSFPFSSPTSSASFDEDKDEFSGTETKRGRHSGTPEVAVLDFAANLCEGLVSDFVMPPSYFDQHNLSLAFEDAYPRTDPDMIPKVVATSPPSSPPSPRSSISPRSSRGTVSLKDRSSKSSSTYSTDSDSSVSSTDSDDSASSSDSSLSPVSGASFFSSPILAAPSLKSSNLSNALMKSGGIKIPSSLMTLLPTGSSNKSKAIPVSPSTTPPVSPPFTHAEVQAAVQTPPAMVMALADPRAMMLKRLAYIHTLRKLREREKRPFRHAVLLHLIILQLRRGITNRHCGEIAEFYVAMSAAQFPPRLDTANTMLMVQQQRNKLQQQQQLLSQQLPQSQIPVLSSSASTIESVQESMIPVRSSSKALSTSITGASGDKEQKSKRSLVFSLQGRSQTSKMSSGNINSNSGESGWSLPSTAPGATTPTASAPSQISVFKERLPLLRIPTYPLINLEKHTNNNNGINMLSSSPARKNLAAVAAGNDTSSEDDNNGIEDGNVDFQPVMAQPVPTVIIPKRTTGRKGLLYQQQLQLRMRQQVPLMGGRNGGADLIPLMAGGMTEQDQARLQSQLAGSRPRFATSTFTTVRSGRSDVVTRPLVPMESVKPLPTSASENAPTWGSFPFAAYGQRPQQSGGSASSTTAIPTTNAATSSGATTSSVSQDGSGSSLPAGLLTPPLSPLFRNPFSPTAASNPSATSTTSGPAKSNDGLSYNNNNNTATTTSSNTNTFNSSIPPPVPPSATSTANNNGNMRSSFEGQGQRHLPPSSSTVTFPTHHARVSSAGSVSSYTLPHIQNSHHTISYLEGQAVHARSRSSHEGNSALPPSSAAAAALSLSRKGNTGGIQMGLPSPPLSPTLDTEGNSAAAMMSTVTASMAQPIVHSAKRAHNLPQRSHSSNGYIHHTAHSHGHGHIGGRSENIAWIMRAPSPVSHQHQHQLHQMQLHQHHQNQQHHELNSRHSMEDMRNHRHWKSSASSTSSTSSLSSSSSSSSSGPGSAPIISPTPSSGSKKRTKKGSSAKAGGVFSPAESEEEDVPLAFVQRRISSDTLRSLA
ncbi:hypothetical protein EC991_002393 [Linnemannia zychae]|nr:hypothetical protein EC991_002393 [Linnemannia zychae]